MGNNMTMAEASGTVSSGRWLDWDPGHFVRASFVSDFSFVSGLLFGDSRKLLSGWQSADFGGDWVKTENEASVTFREDPTGFAKGQIFSCCFLDPREYPDVANPAVGCRRKAAALVDFVYENIGVTPKYAAANVEEGITLFYEAEDQSSELIVEVYNTLEIAAVVNKNRQMVSVKEFESADDSALIEMGRVFVQ